MREAYPNELYHYGVEGMKWGVRRYQNPDGTLTAAGRRRYEIKEAREGVKKAKLTNKEILRKTKTDPYHYHKFFEKQKNNVRIEKAKMDLKVAKARTEAGKQRAIDKYEYRIARRGGDYGLSDVYKRRGSTYTNKIFEKVNKRYHREDVAGTVGIIAGSAVALAGSAWLMDKYGLY